MHHESLIVSKFASRKSLYFATLFQIPVTHCRTVWYHKAMKTYTNDQYKVISENKGILYLVWKPETEHFTTNLFQQSAQDWMQAVEESGIKNILVDMRELHFSLPIELLEWINKNIIARYNDLEIKQFAFLVSEGKKSVQQDSPNNTFVTKTFTEEDRAIEWLLS